jgi:hypothetical protein
VWNSSSPLCGFLLHLVARVRAGAAALPDTSKGRLDAPVAIGLVFRD